MSSVRTQLRFVIAVAILQIAFLIIFAVFAEYHSSADETKRHPVTKGRHDDKSHQSTDHHDEVPLQDYYPMFQDVHVMMFIGFGFLMTFLKKYGFSAVGLNMLIAAFVIQWSLIVSGLLHLHDGKFQITIINLLTADFAAAAVLISFGALLGKASPLQMILIALIEIVIFSVNEYIGVYIFQAVDIGGSMFVHVFGAYFGLAVSRIIYTKDVEDYEHNEGSRYHADLFSMIGTVFLWIYWPSFNSALAPGDDQHRAVINTYLSLAACCVTTFVMSSIVNKRGRFQMEHIQNATLAGGVAVGTTADMMINPWGAVLIGMVAAVLSVIGFKFLTPCLASRLNMHDTCGVNNLHGMPGILAGIAGVIASVLASTDMYGYGLYTQFAAMAPVNGTELFNLQHMRPDIEAGLGRSAAMQGAMQLSALALSFAMAIVGGLITGFIMRLPIFEQPRGKPNFADSVWWEVPEDYEDDYVHTPVMDKKDDNLLTATDDSRI